MTRKVVKTAVLTYIKSAVFLLLFARNDGNVHLGVCANIRKNAEKTTIHC